MSISNVAVNTGVPETRLPAVPVVTILENKYVPPEAVPITVNTTVNTTVPQQGVTVPPLTPEPEAATTPVATPTPVSTPTPMPAPMKCKFRIIEARDIVFGSTVTELIYCVNLTAQTEVRLTGTKDGVRDIDKVIAVTNPVTNPYSKLNYGDFYFSETRRHDAAEKVGLYTRQIVVRDSISQNDLFISEERKYAFLPDLGCTVSITETEPGYVVESADCKYVPSGAVVSLYWPKEDGSYIRHTVTLPYSVHRKHNEFERLKGPSIRYYYYRDIEVTNESRTIYYAANNFVIYILK